MSLSGNSIFRDTTTLTKKCPPPPHIDFNQPLPQDTTSREAHHKNWEQKQQQQESQSESEYTQESLELESESEKEKKIHPLPIPKKVRESSGLLKARSTKFGDQKKKDM